jgi:hypothetical protein
MVSSGCVVGALFGAIADGYLDGIPLAVVGGNPVAVDEPGSTRIVDGINGVVAVPVSVPSGGMLVTPPVSSGPVLVETVELLVEVLLRVVGGVEVSGGTVLLPVGIELLPEKVLDVTTGGSVEVDEVAPVPGPVMPVAVLEGVTVPGLPESVADVVEFVIGGCPGSVVDVDNGGGGSVTVADALVETPVPGPVMPSEGLGLTEAEVVCGGSRTLETAEPMSLKRELIGSLGSDVLELVVTIPVGASRIPDVLDVETGGSTDVDGSCWAAELLVDEGRSTTLLVLLPRTGGSTVEEGPSG